MHCRFDLYHHHFADDSDFRLEKLQWMCGVELMPQDPTITAN